MPLRPLLFLLLLLGSSRGEFESFCDEGHRDMHCTCDVRRGETSVTCFVRSNLTAHAQVWRAVAGIERVVVLKLMSLRPAGVLEVPVDAVRAMAQLRTLSIPQASLGALRSYSVSDHPEIRYLQLDGSEITSLGPDAISNLPALKKLSLSSNFITEILEGSLRNLPELEQLFLDGNQIWRIEPCAFCELQNLQVLELLNNHLEDLTEYMFRGIRLLKRLDLSRNRIRVVNDRVFHPLTNLQELDLTSNQIYHVGSRAFQGLHHLLTLLLNGNKIKQLPDHVFGHLPSLMKVDLSRNELDSLQVQVLQSMENVKAEHFVFSFKDNPLRCDCRLHWVQEYYSVNKSHPFTIELRDVHCTSEDNATELARELSPEPCPTPTTPWPVPYEIQGRKVDKRTDGTLVREGGELPDEKLQTSGHPSRHPVGLWWLLLAVWVVVRRKGTL